MDEAQGLGMKGLTGKSLETVLHKLFVFGEEGTFQDAVAAVFRIIKKRMSGIFEMDAYLMGAACFQATFHQRYITQIFKHPVMGYCMFALIFFRINLHHLAVLLAAANMT